MTPDRPVLPNRQPRLTTWRCRSVTDESGASTVSLAAHPGQSHRYVRSSDWTEMVTRGQIPGEVDGNIISSPIRDNTAPSSTKRSGTVTSRLYALVRRVDRTSL